MSDTPLIVTQPENGGPYILNRPMTRYEMLMLLHDCQNGKGSRPRPVKGDVYRDNWSAIFRKPVSCDICGQFIKWDDFETGDAIRNLITPDSDYSCEEYETYHTKCRKS